MNPLAIIIGGVGLLWKVLAAKNRADYDRPINERRKREESERFSQRMQNCTTSEMQSMMNSSRTTPREKEMLQKKLNDINKPW